MSVSCFHTILFVNGSGESLCLGYMTPKTELRATSTFISSGMILRDTIHVGMPKNQHVTAFSRQAVRLWKFGAAPKPTAELQGTCALEDAGTEESCCSNFPTEARSPGRFGRPVNGWCGCGA